MTIAGQTFTVTQGKTITAGGDHSATLMSDGTIWAWGGNWNGQLGDGTFLRRLIPTRVGGIDNVIVIAGSKDTHTIALKPDSTVWTWGNNNYGQLGDETNERRNTPVEVKGIGNITAIAGGGDHSLAIKSNGTIWAWGLNDLGQLGDGTTINRNLPVQVNGLNNVSVVSAGNSHTLALKSDGTIWGWGSNGSGQLGDGTDNNYKVVPTQVHIDLTGCSYSIAPKDMAFGSTGGNDYVSVTASSSNCGWEAKSDASWITITSESIEIGNKVVYYSVSANTGTAPRTGTMTIAEQIFMVTQEGVSYFIADFQINSGATETANRTVSLNNTATGSPTHYMASESASFSDTTWQTYSTAPSFMLSAGDGAKTVYFNVKNTSWVSMVVNDIITLKELPVVSTFQINNSAAEVTNRTVTLNNTATGSPTEYIASESASFADVTWLTYTVAPPFTLSAGDGAKTVYFKVRNVNDESAVVSDGITLKEMPDISTFQVNNGAAETTSRTVTINNTATGNPTHHMASESSDFSGASWETYAIAPSFRLSWGDGVKTVYFKVKNVNDESVAVSGTITLKEFDVVMFINNNAADTTSRKVTLKNLVLGSRPTQYMASESATFANAKWKKYKKGIKFTLSASLGVKTVYFKVKNATEESSVVSDTITLKKALMATVVDAGVDQLVRKGSVITLDGSRSFRSEENVPLTYQWSFVSLSSGMGGLLSDFKSVSPTFTLKRQGRCEIQLIVKDSIGTASEPDTVVVSTQDTTPVAHAGSDQFIREVGTRVMLNGAQSYDPDGDALAYQWSFISMPAESTAFLEGSDSARPTFVADAPGDYIMQLTVNDGQVHSSSNTVTVSFGNVMPVANAGKSVSVKVGDTVMLAGDGMDANGDALSYRWILASRPDGSLSGIADSSARVTPFIPDRAGAYVAQLVVSDDEFDSEPSAIQIQTFTTRTKTIAAFHELEKRIAELDSCAFKNDDMQNLLLNKLNAVIANVEEGKHAEAANQLRNDILPKMGGAVNAEGDSSVWIIIDRGSQDVWYQEAQDVVKALEMAQ